MSISQSPRPRRLRPDNFTPPQRTPWGGHNILGRYKAGLGLAYPPDQVVGESWEISVEPSFPSRFDDGELLTDAIAADPIAWLGPGIAAAFSRQFPLLMKIVDARDNLSVQVHPALTAPHLAPDESGKVESWTILDAAPRAGIFLGFKDGIQREDVAARLARRGALDELMNFIEVTPEETFIIRPGTPHALGAGITLAEPQLVVPGKKAVTYRFWDWNRLYDEHGVPSPTGKSRTIDIEQSLDATDWTAPRGLAFVEGCRCRRRTLERGPVNADVLVEEGHLRVDLWAGTGSLEVTGTQGPIGLTCLKGVLRIAPFDFALRAGESAVIPAALDRFESHLADASAFAVRLVP